MTIKRLPFWLVFFNQIKEHIRNRKDAKRNRALEARYKFYSDVELEQRLQEINERTDCIRMELYDYSESYIVRPLREELAILRSEEHDIIFELKRRIS